MIKRGKRFSGKIYALSCIFCSFFSLSPLRSFLGSPRLVSFSLPSFHPNTTLSMHFITFSKTPSPFAALLSFLRFIFASASAFCPGKKMGLAVLFLSLLCWVSSANGNTTPNCNLVVVTVITLLRILWYLFPQIKLYPELPKQSLIAKEMPPLHEVDCRSLQSHSIFSVVPRHHPKSYPSVTARSPTQVRSLPTIPTVSPSEPLKMWTTMPSAGPSPVLALSPKYHGYAPSPSKVRSKYHLKRHLKHHHLGKHPAVSPFPPSPPAQGCDLACSDPWTSTPVGSPCGCVVPMQVVLVLGVAPHTVFPHTPELEVEIAAGTCLKQSQVRILGADAGGQDREKTRVNINLVPLSKKFNKTTALLTFERFWQKKVPISRTLFGDYEVISVRYPGLPSSPQLPSGISPTSGNQDPIVANVTSNGQKFTARTVTVIVLSSSVVFLMGTGALVIFLKCKKAGSVPADGPPPMSSISERSGKGGIMSGLSSSISTPKSASLISPKDMSGKIFSLAELEKATENFSSKRLLGGGGFGCVYLGTMEDGSEVAVKRLIMVDQGRDREFIAEVEMLSRLHHRNLVKLVGICMEEGTRCLVYELVHNGSVESHLHGSDQRRIPLDWDARMKIALGAARGLAYLHEDSNPRVIHRDFKAANILLEDDFTPKVSDFGLAREASEGRQQISTQVTGTFGYVAPEYAMTGHLLVKSDVYSYGVVLLELLSGRKPIDMSRPQGHESLTAWARPLLTSREGLEKVVDPSLGGNYDFNDLAKVASIASMCIQPEVMKRPFMGEVVQALMLVYTDKDETYEDSYGLREDSSGSDVDFTGDSGPESWRRGRTPCLTHGISSSFITMEYSSGPLEIMDRPLSTSVLVGEGGSLTGYNRSGPLRTERNKLKFYQLKRSISENGLLVKHIGNNGYMF